MMRIILVFFLFLDVFFLKAQEIIITDKTNTNKPANGLFIDFNGRKLEVYNKDLGIMNWYTAMYKCQQLGDGWRLPNKEELRQIYYQLYKNNKGSFKPEIYWSSTGIEKKSNSDSENENPLYRVYESKTWRQKMEEDENADSKYINAWYSSFEDGISFYGDINLEAYVRPVRDY
jgi:hypothetical protein